MSLMPVSVGHARANYGTKYNIAVGRNTAGGQGWTHEFSFQAYNGPVPNTVPLCVGNTSTDWRHIVKWGVDASGNGWDHTGCCYVHPQHQPGTQAFTVSHHQPQWRWRISKGKGISQEDTRQGWQQDFVFWAIAEQGAGFGHFYIVSHLNNLCLGLDGSNELAMMNKRTGGDKALWKWQGKSLVNKAGQAMDLEGGSSQPGSRVLGWDLHGNINQQWRLEGKHLGCQGNNLVLDIMDNNRNQGAKVKVWTKNHPPTPNQLWKLEYH